MYVAHNAFYLACTLRGCDMSTVFLYEYTIYEQTTVLIGVVLQLLLVTLFSLQLRPIIVITAKHVHMQ